MGVGVRDFQFYVIEDLRKEGVPKFGFQSLDAALEKFESLSDDGMATFGIKRGLCFWELMHRVDGENVLVQDYQNQSFPDSLRDIRDVLDEVAGRLVQEGMVRWTYSGDFFDRTGRVCPVIVPLMNGDVGAYDGSCGDKRLKTVSSLGFDAINQLLISGHGWVDYRDVREDPGAFSENGFLFVEGVNVNYVFRKNMVGVDGQMNVTPLDFSRMLEDINKEFSLKVFDKGLGSSYIVDSFDNLRDAVREWYGLPAELTAHVEQRVGYSCQQVVFNGIDDDFEEIPFEKAAEMYGFEEKPLLEKPLEEMLEEVYGRAECRGREEVQEVEKGLF